MPGDTGYAVVSCHVERPLDDAVWSRYLAFVRRRPFGFRVASLMRPPFEGEDGGDRFVERARLAAEAGPLGHHTHWTSPTHARPSGGDPAELVRREGEWLRARGLEPRYFCGGGWYGDAAVLDAIADLGYVDCTATAWRPAYLPPGAPRLALDRPAWLALGDGRRVAEIPTTHSLGAAGRALLGRLPRLVHVHFHDYELLDGRRRAVAFAVLAALAARRRPIGLDDVDPTDEVPGEAVCVSG